MLPWFELMKDEGAHVPAVSAGSTVLVQPSGRNREKPTGLGREKLRWKWDQHRVSPPGSRPRLPRSGPEMPLHHLQTDTGDLPSPCVPLPGAAHGGRTRGLPFQLSAPASAKAAGFSVGRRGLRSSPTRSNKSTFSSPLTYQSHPALIFRQRKMKRRRDR